MLLSYSNFFLVSFLLLLLTACIVIEANSLPSGFIAESVTSKNAISGVFATNPRNGWKPMMLLVNKGGTVSVLEDPDDSSDSTEILELEDEICTNTERGLQSIALHPDFEDNRYVYLYYTKNKDDCLADDSEDGPWNVISRFIMDPETLMLDYDEREEIWRGAPLHDSVHNGGSMIFGNDHKLYVTTGDGGTPENGQDRRTVLGSLIRLDDDGSTPGDNPFTTANGYESYHCRKTEGKVPSDSSDDAVCSEIFATGFRNPFRLSMDPNEKEKTKLAISDVGGRTWEEINFAGTDYEGANYGHKLYEGPCLRHSIDKCPISDEYEEPFYWYQHRENKDGCVAGSTFVPEGLWSEEYKFLFLDFVFYEIYTLIEDNENACRTCIPPIPKYRNETFYHSITYPDDDKNEARMVDMFFGPYKDTQALYVVKFGNFDTVIRIRYTGIHNEAPLVNFDFEDKDYDVDENVQFDGSMTEDPEGDELTFKWFFGDGAKSTNTNPTHTYKEPGAHTVTLTVIDSFNQIQEKSKKIQIGTPPRIKILSPVEGDLFYVGQILRLRGKAFYANGTVFNESLLEWEVHKHHDDHYHPFLAQTFGNDFDIYPAPEPEDFYASLNSYLEIILYATEENGLVSQTSRQIHPALVMVNVKSNIPGTKILIEDEPITTPEQVWSWKEQDIHLKVENSLPYVFDSWSDGVRDPERVVKMNYSEPIFEAIFCVNDGGDCLLRSLSCCMGECNAYGICTIPINIPPMKPLESLEPLKPSKPLEEDITPPPIDQPMSSPTNSPTAILSTPELSSLRYNNASNSLEIDINSDVGPTISTAGKASLSAACLSITIFVALLVYKRKIRQDATNINVLTNEKVNNKEENISCKGHNQDTLINVATSISSSDNVSVTV